MPKQAKQGVIGGLGAVRNHLKPNRVTKHIDLTDYPGFRMGKTTFGAAETFGSRSRTRRFWNTAVRAGKRVAREAGEWSRGTHSASEFLRRKGIKHLEQRGMDPVHAKLLVEKVMEHSAGAAKAIANHVRERYAGPSGVPNPANSRTTDHIKRGGAGPKGAGIVTTQGLGNGGRPRMTGGTSSMIAAPFSVGSGYSNPYAMDTTTIRRREVLGLSIQSTTSTTPMLLFARINPGNPILFPWGHKIMTNYELFKINSMKFTYHPTSATSATGRICLAWDPDETDTAPSTIAQMLQMAGAVAGPYFSTLELDIPKKFFQPDHTTAKFISTHGSTGFQYDLGKLYIATDGATTQVECGYVEVEYDITLTMPQLHDWVHNSCLSLYRSPIANTEMATYLDGAITSAYDNLTAAGVTYAGRTVTFPATDLLRGDYVWLIQVSPVTGANIASQVASCAYAGGVSGVNAWFNQAGANVACRDGDATAAAFAWFAGGVIRLSGQAGSLVLPHLGVCSANWAYDLTISRLPSLLSNYVMDNVDGFIPRRKAKEGTPMPESANGAITTFGRSFSADLPPKGTVNKVKIAQEHEKLLVEAFNELKAYRQSHPDLLIVEEEKRMEYESLEDALKEPITNEGCVSPITTPSSEASEDSWCGLSKSTQLDPNNREIIQQLLARKSKITT